MEELRTNKFRRDKRTKALLACDERQLEAHEKRKEINKARDEHINKIEDELKQLRQIVDTLVENNN